MDRSFLNLNRPFLLPVKEQMEEFKKYGDWLKSVQEFQRYGRKIEGVIKRDEEEIMRYPNAKKILSFSHFANRVLTARLALSYFFRNDTNLLWLSEEKFFDRVYTPGDIFPSLPVNGFYFSELYDDEGLGKKCQGLTLKKAIEKVRGDWQGITSEIFQYLCITHRHYFYAMDGVNYPYLLVAGFRFDKKVPYISRQNETIVIGSLDVEARSENYGAVFARNLFLVR